MNSSSPLARQWIVTSVVAGILGVVAYVCAIAPVPLPDVVRTYLGFAFGPFIAVAFAGYYHFFKLHRDSVTLQIGIVFGFVAAVIVNMMLVVQAAIFDTIPAAARADLGLAFEGINMVQLGLDVSWDLFFSVSMILIGLAMFGHPRFGFVWGAAAVVIGAGLIVLNLATFPIPPADAQSIDLGPVAGSFYLFATLRIWGSLKWVDAQLAAGAN